MSSRISLCAMVLVSILCPVLIASDLEYEPGEVIVRFALKTEGKQQTIAERNAILTAVGVGKVKDVSKFVPGLTLVKLAESMSVENAIIVLDSTDGILSAQPNYIYRAFSTFPNDPYGPKPAPDGGKQWHLNNIGQDPPGGTSGADIDAPEGWDIQTGSTEIIVAVIDTGVDYEHEDLADNMWVNEAELNGIPDHDDDGNGYKDDIYGYDFCQRGQERDSDPMDDHGHGTACAGIVGADGNNSVGVTGVCWNIKIMSIKFLDDNGEGDSWDAFDSINYALANGADILSCSWGGGSEDPQIKTAIENAKNNGRNGKGCVIVFCSHNQNDAVAYPAKYPEVIAVGATDHSDERWYYSNYGPELDVMAPSAGGEPAGVIMWTTDISGEGGYNPGDLDEGDEEGRYYKWFGGTSGATPQVAGLAALILSVNPSLTSNEVQFIIQYTADDKGTLGRDDEYGWGRINNYSALLEAVEFPTDDELVGWWKFDDGSGPTAEDSVGDKNGTLVGDTTWVDGKIYGALDFDGDNDYVSLSPIGALVTDNVTIFSVDKTTG